MDSESSEAARSAAVEISNCSVAVRKGTLERSVVQALRRRPAVRHNNRRAGEGVREWRSKTDKPFSPSAKMLAQPRGNLNRNFLSKYFVRNRNLDREPCHEIEQSRAQQRSQRGPETRKGPLTLRQKIAGTDIKKEPGEAPQQQRQHAMRWRHQQTET